jgi:hypothetical protein
MENQRLSDREAGQPREGEMERKGSLAQGASDEDERCGHHQIQAQEDHGEAEHFERRPGGGAQRRGTQTQRSMAQSDGRDRDDACSQEDG